MLKLKRHMNYLFKIKIQSSMIFHFQKRKRLTPIRKLRRVSGRIEMTMTRETDLSKLRSEQQGTKVQWTILMSCVRKL